MKWKPVMAVLIGLLMVGMRAEVTGAQPLRDSQIKPQDTVGVDPTEWWEIVSVSPFYTTYGAWKNCVSGYGNPPDSLTCSFQNTNAYTWSNTYSGSLMVSIATLNSAVGFSVTHSGTVERSATYHYEYQGQHLLIQYRDIYKTKTVKQVKYCTSRLGVTRKCGEEKVYARKWDHLDFRPVDLGN